MRKVVINENIRYEPDDRCPLLLSAGVALQGVMLILPTVVVIVGVTARVAGQDGGYLSWALFAGLLVGGGATALQGGKLGRLGAGHLVITSATPAYLAVSVLALSAGGPALLATSIVVVALTHFALAAWLPSLRGLITPVVSGTVLMLIAGTILPISFDTIVDVPSAVSPAAGPAIAAVFLVVTAGMYLRAQGAWRFWTSLIGIGAGCAVAALMGSYDFRPVLEAPWFGIPGIYLPGLDLTPGAEFWALLPLFVIVGLVVGIKNMAAGVIVQRVSRRQPAPTDFRVVQGVLNSNAVGVLLSGIAGIPPTTVYSSSSATIVNLTGVASRRVGYLIGVFLAVLAFVPKLVALLLTIPGPVMGAYLVLRMGMLFVEGMRTVLRDGLGHRRGLVVALAFSIGVGLDDRGVFTDMLGETWGASLDSGMMSGALVALVLTLFMQATGKRRARLKVHLDMSALPEIDRYLTALATDMRWNTASTERLRAAGEETLSCLLQDYDDSGEATDAPPPRLVVVVRPERGAIEMDYIAVFSEDNLEDRIAHLDERIDLPDEREISFRLLRHYASSVRHRKYHGAEVVTVRVDAS